MHAFCLCMLLELYKTWRRFCPALLLLFSILPSSHQHHHHTNTNTTTHPSYDPEVMVRNVTKAASLREFMTNPQGLRYWTNTYAMHTTSPTTLHPRLYMLCSTLP